MTINGTLDVEHSSTLNMAANRSPPPRSKWGEQQPALTVFNRAHDHGQNLEVGIGTFNLGPGRGDELVSGLRHEHTLQQRLLVDPFLSSQATTTATANVPGT